MESALLFLPVGALHSGTGIRLLAYENGPVVHFAIRGTAQKLALLYRCKYHII